MKKVFLLILLILFSMVSIAQNKKNIQDKIEVIDLTTSENQKTILIILNKKDYFFVSQMDINQIVDNISTIISYRKDSEIYNTYLSKIKSNTKKIDSVCEIETKKGSTLPEKFIRKK